MDSLALFNFKIKKIPVHCPMSSNVVINLNFGANRAIGPVPEVRQRSLAIEPEAYQLEPVYEPLRYLIYEDLTALDVFQYRESNKGKGKVGKQCKTGQACGNTCISKTKTCNKGLSGPQKGKAKAAKAKTTAKGKAGAAGGGSAYSKGYSKEEQSKLAAEHQKNLYGIAAGMGDTRDAETIKRQDEALKNDNNSKAYQAGKIKRLMDDGLNEEEAHGIAAWIEGRYAPMNQAIYAPGTLSGEGQAESGLDYGEGAGIRALQGLKKLPSYSHEQIMQVRGDLGSDASVLDAGTLRRGVAIPDSALDSFLKPYQDAIGQDEYKEPTFFATTARSSHSITDSTNVKYLIKSKSDGTGQGRLVDQYKNGNFEGEVLYPPYSRFKVTEVEVQPPKSIKTGVPKAQLEKLPKSTQDKLDKGEELSPQEFTKVRKLAAFSMTFHAWKNLGNDSTQSLKDEIFKEFGVTPLSNKAAVALYNNLSGYSKQVTIIMEEI